MKKSFGIWAVLFILCAGLTAEAQDNLIHPAKIGITAGTGMRWYTELPYLLSEDAWVGVIRVSGRHGFGDASVYPTQERMGYCGNQGRR
jgi:hypothetical protein